MSNERVRLPESTHIDEMRQSFDAALRVITEDLGHRLAEVGEREYGSDWQKRLGLDDVPLRDPSALLKLLSREGPASRVLGMSKAQRSSVGRIVEHRHSLAHHEDAWQDPHRISIRVDGVRDVAHNLNLPAEGPCIALRNRLRDLADRGMESTQGGVEAEVLRIEQTASEVKAAEEASAESASRVAEVEAERDQLAAMVQELTSHASDRAAESEEARRRATEFAARAAEAEAGQAQALADAAEQAAQVRAEAERELAKMRDELAAKDLELELREAAWREKEERERTAREEAVAQARMVEVPPASAGLELARLQQALQRAAHPAQATPSSHTADSLPAPGEPWPYPRGNRALRLSARDGDLTTLDGDSLAIDLGTADLAKTVAAFLRIRPAGGRVWVDEDGDCSTLVQGRLVYLGRLAEDQPAPLMHPGARLEALPDGPRYLLHKTDVADTNGTRLLSQVRGSQIAAQVARRLCTAKPGGGRIWVGPDGLVAARDAKDGHPYYLGHVRADEWFATHSWATTTRATRSA